MKKKDEENEVREEGEEKFGEEDREKRKMDSE